MLDSACFRLSCSRAGALAIRIFSLTSGLNSLKNEVFFELRGERTMSGITRRAMVAAIAVSALLPGAAFAADALKEIHIDWATYNPVSMILKQKGLLEKEFAKDGISVV